MKTEAVYNPIEIEIFREDCSGAYLHRVSSESLKGKQPESWLCIDCGTNTAPGCHNRAELEAAFAADQTGNSVTSYVDAQSEIYQVRAAVWAAAGMESWGGCLCIACLEQRLGRTLKPKDFQRGHVFNEMPGTPRLLKRRGRAKETRE